MFTDCGKYLRLWNKNGKLYLVFFCIDLMPHYLFQIIKCSQNTAKDSPFLFILDSRQQQPTPVLLPGESHGRRSLVGCRLWGRTESDMTEATQQQHYQPIVQLDEPLLLWRACVHVQSLSRVRLFATPWTVARQAPLSMGLSWQECWSGLPFPSPGDLPNPGSESLSLALAGRET